MQKHEILIAGDVGGVEWHLPFFTFKGKDTTAPKAYLQAALHADELPGVVALHVLIPMLRTAYEKGQVLGDIVVVPKANPIGAAQWFSGEPQGRFDLASRGNYNRDFPLIKFEERSSLVENISGLRAVEQLKRHLLHMALAADLVLDLHCDSESLLYAYLDEAFWPRAQDLAESFGLDAVLLSDGKSSAFEEAVSHAWRTADEPGDWQQRRISLTMEFRGQADVRPDLAKQDAMGLYAFLQRRGTIAGEPLRREIFSGPASPLDCIAVIKAPLSGTVLFEKTYGEKVKKGDHLARIIPAPGEPEHDHVMTAPADGLIVTRVLTRFVRRGDNLMKIAADAPVSKTRKPGTLED